MKTYPCLSVIILNYIKMKLNQATLIADPMILALRLIMN